MLMGRREDRQMTVREPPMGGICKLPGNIEADICLKPLMTDELGGHDGDDVRGDGDTLDTSQQLPLDLMTTLTAENDILQVTQTPDVIWLKGERSWSKSSSVLISIRLNVFLT